MMLMKSCAPSSAPRVSASMLLTASERSSMRRRSGSPRRHHEEGDDQRCRRGHDRGHEQVADGARHGVAQQARVQEQHRAAIDAMPRP